jgi:hypothetical protein
MPSLSDGEYTTAILVNRHSGALVSTPLASQRLLRLEEILAQSRTPAVVADAVADPVKRHLESVPLERIRQLTAELEARGAGATDEIDAVVMRLLLTDYVAAVTHLRAVTRAAEAHMDAASGPIADVRQFVWRELKLQEARRQAAEQLSSTYEGLRPTRLQDEGSDV